MKKKKQKTEEKINEESTGKKKVEKPKVENNTKSKTNPDIFNTVLKVFLISFISVTTITGSYIYFMSHKPKALKEISENKDFNPARKALELPRMQGTTEIGINETEKQTQITLEVEKKPEEVRTFYTNVMKDKGWTRISSTNTKDSLVDKFRSEKQQATISISQKEDSEVSVIGIVLENK